MIQIALPERISEKLQKTKDFINETAAPSLTSLNEVSEQAKTSLLETAGKAKDTLTQTKNQAVNTLNQATNTALESVSDITEKAKGTVSETTTKALTTITNTKNQAVNSVTEVSDKAKASLENTFQQVDLLNRSISDGIQSAISASFNAWILDHPRLVWLVNHPLQTIGILLLIIFLFSGLFRAISSSTEKLWLFLLQAPFKLIQFIFGLGYKSLGNVKASGLVAMKSNENLTTSERQERITHILSRLAQIKQEQDLLLQELATLIKSDKTS